MAIEQGPRTPEKVNTINVLDISSRTAYEVTQALDEHGTLYLTRDGNPVAVIQPFTGTTEDLEALAADQPGGVVDVTPPPSPIYGLDQNMLDRFVTTDATD